MTASERLRQMRESAAPKERVKGPRKAKSGKVKRTK